MFHKKTLKSRRSKVTMLFEENIQCPSFSSTPIFSWIPCTKDPTVSPSNAFFIPCRYYSSFFLTVYSIQVSGSHKYIEFSAALWFKVCLMRCLEIWLSFQISRGKMSVCRIFEGPLFKIQFDWPKSLLWQHPAFSLIPTSTVGLPSQLWLFTLKQRDTFPSGSAS